MNPKDKADEIFDALDDYGRAVLAQQGTAFTTYEDFGDKVCQCLTARASAWLAAERRALVKRIRAACAAEWHCSPDYPFFHHDRRLGEKPDELLLRRFHEEQRRMPNASETDVINVLIHG